MSKKTVSRRIFYKHSSSVVHKSVSIGRGTKIWHFCHVMKGARIGENCVLGQNVFVAGGVVIGDRVKIQNNVSLYDGVELEEGVFCGPSCVFTNIAHPRSFISRKDKFEQTFVGRGATIGANATIVCGVKIGRFAFVGAGSVVTHDVLAQALVYGVPAKRRGWVCECGEKLIFNKRNTHCARCKRRYRKFKNGIQKL